jgi:nicotinamide-nucleotide amidase
MEYLLVGRAVPYLRERYGIKGEIRLRVLKVVGLGESRVGELLSDFMESTGNPTVGTVAHLGQVDVRIGAKGLDAADAERLIQPLEAEIRSRLGDAVFGVDEQTLEGEVVGRLRAVGARLAVAESGTAGVASERLAAVGADVFAGGVVLTDTVGAARLGVSVTTAAEPEARAGELAGAVARWAGVAVGAASWFEDVRDASPPITRVALGVATPTGTATREYRLGGDRPSMRIRAATLLLDHVRRALLH